ncbi:MAG TPA: penicillin-binding protein 2 [Acidimicrobiales bacterium]|nr:penicillin-binding protein 2 [Acidimicrobiales bacterium]
MSARTAARPRHRRRLVVSLVAMVGAFAVLAGRVVQVQGLAADRYAEVGESQRVREVSLPAYRGAIFDRNGHDLALTVRQSSVVANPQVVADPLAAAAALAPVLDMEPGDLQDRLIREQAFVYLARTVDDDVAARVADLDIPGVELRPEPERFLPAGTLALPLLGKVGTDNTGLSGLERQFDEALAGRPGTMVVERDPNGREIPGGVRRLEPADRGDDLVLTIDRSIQHEAERSLAGAIVRHNAKGGMAIVMETATGEVLALANLVTPAAGGPPVPARKNTALTDVFEPGSVNKVITISGAIEDGVVDAAETLTVPDTIRVADHTFSEHDPHPVARWSVTDIMANSSNVGSIMIGQRLGKARIDHYLRSFGFGNRTGLGFPGESGGILLDPKKWSGTSIGTVPIGQGVAVTAMQMLAAYNAVANGGVYVAPSLVRATVDADGVRHDAPPAPRRTVVSPATAAQVTAMLTEVVRVGTGTEAAIDGYSVAGKTGTARKPKVDARGYQEGAYVAGFAGFVPAERPALAAIVILDEPTPIFGGIVAAPVFAELAGYALRHLQVPPPPPDPARVAGTAAVPEVSPDSARAVGEVGAAASPTTTIAPSRPPQPTQ